MGTDDDLGEAIGGLAAGDRGRAVLAKVLKLARASMRTAGSKSVATGRWLAEVVMDAAPHIPVRDLATISAAHGGRTGPDLAGELIRTASRTTAGVGAIAGAIAGAEELAPPTLLAVPAELLVETLAVVAIELKLVAELHEVYGQPVTGTAVGRSLAVVRSWAEGRGVTARTLAEPGAVTQTVGRGARQELVRLLQRRLTRRALRSTAALSPLLSGAVAAAELNRRATRTVGERVARDLASRRPGATVSGP